MVLFLSTYIFKQIHAAPAAFIYFQITAFRASPHQTDTERSEGKAAVTSVRYIREAER